MRKSVYLGIDFGTTVLKICAFDSATGHILAHASENLKVRHSANGGREQRIPSINRIFSDLVHEIQIQLGARWNRVESIGLAAQGGSTLIADRKTGKPLTSMILWNDGRTHGYTETLAEEIPLQYRRKHLFCDSLPAGLGRLLWLSETRPGLFHENHIHVGAGEYLYFTLTNIWRQDPGNAIQIGSYHAAKKRLDSFLFRRIAVPLSFVASLRRGHETAPLSLQGARLLGLPEGIPVAGPYIDQESGFLSAARVSKRPLHCSLGTAWVGNFVLPDETTGFSPTQLVLPSPLGRGRLIVQPLLTGNTAWDWGLRTFADNNLRTAIAKATRIFSKSLLPRDGLVAFPWFSQPNPLYSSSHGAGGFFGLDAQTTPDDQLRALAAGMAFELRRVFGSLIESDRVDSIVLGGGASKGTYFQEMIAGLFSPVPVFRQMEEEFSTARGTIFSFDPNVSQTKSRLICPPDSALLMKIRHHYDYYLKTISRLYPLCATGKAFSFAERE
ncbi:MAG TPA: FGGY-family carbohydrate kinase [bacterium]|nr:FGGY-family carbohydrate kinase [bacterium]HQP99128.1 FGGY-family carbohydrate kinase [bacterium]